MNKTGCFIVDGLVVKLTLFSTLLCVCSQSKKTGVNVAETNLRYGRQGGGLEPGQLCAGIVQWVYYCFTWLKTAVIAELVSQKYLHNEFKYAPQSGNNSL